MIRIGRLFLVLFLVGSAGAAEEASEPPEPWDPGPNFHRLDTSVKTPHWRWARPWAGDPVRVVAVGGRHCLREAVELHQRLNCDIDIIPSEGRTQWTLSHPSRDGWGVLGCTDLDEVIARHLETLSRAHDVIVLGLGTLDWESMPTALREALIDKVREGTGMLVTRPRNGGELPEYSGQLTLTALNALGSNLGKVRGSRFPDQDGRAELEVAQLGEGTVVVLTHPEGARDTLLTGGATSLAEYEHAFQLAMRAVLMAADRVATLKWERLDLEDDALIGELEAQAATVELALFDLWERKLDVSLWHNTSSFMYQVPQLPAGRYFCRLRILDAEGRVVNWGAHVVETSGEPRIAKLTPRQDLRYAGKPARWDIVLSAAGSDTVAARVFDRAGRLLGEFRAPVEGKTATLDIEVPPTRVVYHQLEVDVLVGDRVTDRQRRSFGVQQSVDCRDMHVGFWGHRGRETYPERWRQRYYRRLGIDMAMFAIKPVHGIRIMDYAGHLPRIVWDKPEEPPPFPGDPTFREQVTESMRKRLMRTGEWSPALASLRDEPSYRYTDRSPVAMKAYREWLRERHGDLATLNERWGTEYSAWEEVERIDLHQTRRRDDVGPVAGYDSSLFNRTVTGDFFAWQQSVIDDLLPGLRAGPEGVWSNPEYYSIDYVRALRELGSTGCYVWAKDMLAAARAFGRADQILGAWFGGYGFADPDYLRANPWQVVFEDMNAPMWFEGARIHSSPVPMPLVNPGWDLHAVTAPVFKEIDKLNGGLARLLLGAERRDSGICMVRPTIVPDVRGYSRWLYALEALGHQARLIQEDELIDGGLAGADMLVLSGVAALEDAHAAAIQEWVEKGGLVVADHVPGVLDKYGAERAKGALDDLFGVLERSDSSEKEENVRIQWGEIEAPVAAGDVSRAENAMGKLVPNGLPAVFYRSVGKGQSLCLNAAIGGKEMKPADTLRLVAEVLKHLDIAPPLSITTDQPHTAGLQVIRYRRKPLDLIALHRQPFPNESRGGEEWDARWNVSVPLPESAHVYDAYAGRYLGRIDGWVGLLEWGRPVLLACLPGKVIAGNITAPRDVKQGERVKIVFSFDCGEAPYAGVANVTFRKPDGDEMYVLSRNLDFKDGLVTVTWDVARNEVPGLWRVSCRDAATGVTATHTIGVVREADAGEINIAR